MFTPGLWALGFLIYKMVPFVPALIPSFILDLNPKGQETHFINVGPWEALLPWERWPCPPITPCGVMAKPLGGQTGDSVSVRSPPSGEVPALAPGSSCFTQASQRQEQHELLGH